MTYKYKLFLAHFFVCLGYAQASLLDHEHKRKRKLVPQFDWNEKFEANLAGTYVGKAT